MTWLKRIGGWLIAGGVAVLSGLAIALKLISIGKQQARSDTEKAQQDIEQHSQEVRDDAHKSSVQSLDQARADRERGDGRYLNDDELL